MSPLKGGYLEVGEGEAPVVSILAAGQQQGAVALQAADVQAVVGGGGRSVHVAGVEHCLLRGVVAHRHAVHREPPLTRRLVESVGQLQPDASERGGNNTSFILTAAASMAVDSFECN